MIMSKPMEFLHSLLGKSSVYSLGMWALGADHARRVHISKYIQPKVGERILDVGCGPADVLEYLPSVSYIGVDFEPNYIATARERFGDRATFMCKDVTLMQQEDLEPFDTILATGLLHHLSDGEVRTLLDACKKLLKPTGKMVTYDGCRVPNQHPFDRWMLDNDRGKFVRTRDAYAELASSVFPSVEINLHSNLLRIPYTHAIMTLSLVPNHTMALHHSALLNDFSKP